MAYELKRNDLLPVLRATLTQGDPPVPIDLTAATEVFAVFKKPDASVLRRAATILDAAAGRVEFVWQAGDTSPAGTWEVEFEIDFTGKPQTVPSDKEQNPKFEVDADLG